MDNTADTDPTDRITFSEVDNTHHNVAADEWIQLLADARQPIERAAFGGVDLLDGVAADGRRFTAVWHGERMRIRYIAPLPGTNAAAAG